MYCNHNTVVIGRGGRMGVKGENCGGIGELLPLMNGCFLRVLGTFVLSFRNQELLLYIKESMETNLDNYA